MSDFVLYGLIDGQWEEVARYADRERYVAAIRRYFDMKAAEGKPQEASDIVLGLMPQPIVVARGKFGTLKRALRQHDEIGYSSDLADAVDEAKGAGATAVGWGADAATLAELPPHDFGDLIV